MQSEKQDFAIGMIIHWSR